MGETHEVRIHGRGGQGAVLACSILAQALIEDGKHAVTIPSFGFERRGAPVAAFLRFSADPIRAMTNVYHPDCVVCIDPAVARSVDIFAGMKPGGIAVLATTAKLAELKFPDAVSRVGLCDAVGIALAIYRKPVTNAVMLGAFARATGLLTLASLKDAFQQMDFRDAGLAENLAAVERGYAETSVFELKQEAHAAAVA
ncbi:MAG TPA: 2-oxoacid:acceptor oxidoreductase family protein [Stellaceae bacterium]|nr:2-oxoacid:acceptor oxidoreductase family protein [Stellaceae bacterium]